MIIEANISEHISVIIPLHCSHDLIVNNLHMYILVNSYKLEEDVFYHKIELHSDKINKNGICT